MPAVFTSVTLAYLAKARVLAKSVHQHDPSTTVYLVLAEPAPDWLRTGVESGSEPFDRLITVEDLQIPDWRVWLFQHDVVEACTALKGAALVNLLEEQGEDRVLYLDPDVLVLSPLGELFDHLERHALLLTPHCPDAEDELEAIVFNEISSLAHGVYNLGFLGVSRSAEGRRFAAWWWHRLYHFCQDNIPRWAYSPTNGGSTSCRRSSKTSVSFGDARFNAASWNITQREIVGDISNGIRANGEPLCFYHFSGANAGVPEQMYRQLGIESRAVEDLVKHYRSRCEEEGESEMHPTPWHFADLFRR